MKIKCPHCGNIQEATENNNQTELLSKFFKTPVYVECSKCGEMIDKINNIEV